jgi:hypothetical protein
MFFDMRAAALKIAEIQSESSQDALESVVADVAHAGAAGIREIARSKLIARAVANPDAALAALFSAVRIETKMNPPVYVDGIEFLTLEKLVLARAEDPHFFINLAMANSLEELSAVLFAGARGRVLAVKGDGEIGQEQLRQLVKEIVCTVKIAAAADRVKVAEKRKDEKKVALAWREVTAPLLRKLKSKAEICSQITTGKLFPWWLAQKFMNGDGADAVKRKLADALGGKYFYEECGSIAYGRNCNAIFEGAVEFAAKIFSDRKFITLSIRDKTVHILSIIDEIKRDCAVAVDDKRIKQYDYHKLRSALGVDARFNIFAWFISEKEAAAICSAMGDFIVAYCDGLFKQEIPSGRQGEEICVDELLRHLVDGESLENSAALKAESQELEAARREFDEEIERQRNGEWFLFGEE